jgi:hypothetical protein
LSRAGLKAAEVLCFLTLFAAAAAPASAAVLFQSDWSTAVGSDANAVTDGGRWTDWYGDPNTNYVWYTVFTDDATVPGGRNYLRLYDRPSGQSNLYAHCHAHGATDCNGGEGSPMMAGNPTVMYFRMWFRLNPAWDTIEHLIVAREQYWNADPDDIFLFAVRGNREGAMSIGIQGEDGNDFSAMVEGHPEIMNGGWHRWEVKIDLPGTSTATFTCRLDGVDVTSTMRHPNSGEYLSAVNGTITTRRFNYMKWELYDHTQSGGGGGYDRHFTDITGLMFTDGPDWIGTGNGGGDGTPPAPPRELRVN